MLIVWRPRAQRFTTENTYREHLCCQTDEDVFLICFFSMGIMFSLVETHWVKSSHIYLYSAFYSTDCIKASSRL